MNPGRELDALVAEKVMGLALCKCTEEDIMSWRSDLHAQFSNLGTVGRWGSDGKCSRCGKSVVAFRSYSTDIAAAWELLDKLPRPTEGWDGQCELVIYFDRNEIALEDGNGYEDGYTAWTVSGQSMPHAICLAALKAVGVEA